MAKKKVAPKLTTEQKRAQKLAKLKIPVRKGKQPKAEKPVRVCPPGVWPNCFEGLHKLCARSVLVQHPDATAGKMATNDPKALEPSSCACPCHALTRA